MIILVMLTKFSSFIIFFCVVEVNWKIFLVLQNVALSNEL